MRSNNVKRALMKGEVQIGTWIAGFDFEVSLLVNAGAAAVEIRSFATQGR